MNYEEVARKIEKEFADAYYFSLKSDGAGGYLSYELADAIAAALRRAANEAAWDGYDCGFGVCEDIERCRGATAKRLDAEMLAKYGPRPKENRDE